MPVKNQGRFRFNAFEIDLAKRSLERDGHPIAISPQTFKLLRYFVCNPGRIISQTELLRALWPDSTLEESNLGQQLFLLRKALSGSQPGDLTGDRVLATIAGRGFQFTPQLNEAPDQDFGRRLAFTSSRRTQRMESNEPPPEVERPIFVNSGKEQTGALETNSSESVKRRRPAFGKVLVAFLGTMVIAGGGWAGMRWLHRPRPSSIGVVLADFDNATENQEFDLALRKALSIDLRQSPFLSIATEPQVAEALSQIKSETGRPHLEPLPREVCQRLNRQIYLSGSIRRLGQKYLVTVEAINCGTNKAVAKSRGIADSSDGVISVLDKVAADLRGQLGEPYSSSDSIDSISRFDKPLFSHPASSLAALRAYAIASQLGVEGKLLESVSHYQKAIDVDPQFALAYADLGSTYAALGQRDLAANNLGKAFELRDTVDELDRLFIIATWNDLVTGDSQASLRNYRSWADLYPRDPIPLGNIANLEIEIGKPAMALDPARKALELSQGDSISYEIMANAQMHLGQFEEAQKTCEDAIAHHVDSLPIHVILLEIAFHLLDQPSVDEQLAWAKNRPGGAAMDLQRVRMDLAAGKVKAGQAALNALAETYRKQNHAGQAEGVLRALPRTLAEFGMLEVAHNLLSQLPKLADAADTPVDQAVALADTGESARAQAVLDATAESKAANTLWRDYDGPQIRAAIALNQHLPAEALHALEAALPYDLRDFDATALRGRAYLASGQAALAEAEYRKILDHQGVDPLSHLVPIAELGLARSLAGQGKSVDATLAYKVVLQMWSEADADLPRLKEAKAEYARLGGTNPAAGNLAAKSGSVRTDKTAPSEGTKPSAIRRETP